MLAAQLHTLTGISYSNSSQVSAGTVHACALTPGASPPVACWGWNLNGQSSVPINLAGGNAGGRRLPPHLRADAIHHPARSPAGAATSWANST